MPSTKRPAQPSANDFGEGRLLPPEVSQPSLAFDRAAERGSQRPAGTSTAWRLDERTRQIGLQGVAQAREVLAQLNAQRAA